MTLVLSCLTPECVIQVSDRRLSNVESGRALPGQFNKAVCFTNRIAFSYTGLAKINGQDTDEWLADALASGDDENECLIAVGDRATEAFARFRAPLALKTHAFVGVGWHKLAKDEPWRPWLCSISNSLDAEGRWRFPPRDRFQSHSHVLTPTGGERPVALSVVGQRLKRDEQVALMRDLRRYVEHHVGPGAVSDRLVEQVRAVAARTQTVSPEVMVNAIPLLPDKFESGEVAAISARPTLDTHAFSYIPAGKTAEVELGPRGAFPGGGQFFDFRSRQLGAPGDVEVVLGFKTARR